MAIREALAALFGRENPVEHVEWLGPTFRSMVLGLTPEELYRTQPHLRIVLDFVARNVAHLGLPVFERVGETDRRRLRDDPVAKLLGRPNASMTRYELIESLVLDLGLYDRAYWLVGAADSPSGWEIQPIPPSWVVSHAGGGAFAPAKYTVAFPNGTRAEIDASDMLVFHGWNPGRPKHGTSPVETLKQILAEQVQAWSYREQVWQRGGRAGTVITRPAGAEWSDAARERFVTDWKARWTGKSGEKAGGTPILEDGMTINRLGFSAREDEWSEVAKVALATVASVYHVNPVMVGVLDNANFSNTREFRKMLYSETLGPLLAMIEDRINTFLVPRLTKGSVYVEFNIEEKLQGDFEEQGKILSTSTGAPWMTRNEARALRNLPRIEGGDELVTPLNVLVGGQASPQDGVTAGGGSLVGFAGVDGESAAKEIAMRVTAATSLIRAGFDPTASLLAVGLDPVQHLGLLPVTIQKPAESEGGGDTSPMEDGAKRGPVGFKAPAGSVKAAVGDDDSARVGRVMRDYFKHQRGAVLSRLGAKSPDWWDRKHWDEALTKEILQLLPQLTSERARDFLKEVGLDPDGYDVEQTQAFLEDVAESRAKLINAATLRQLEAILAGEGPAGVTDPAHAFDVAESQRVDTISATIAGWIAAFATAEAGKQTGAATKTWLVTSTNPRSEHARMNGEMVGIDEKFSNGANWPGDPVLGADGVANCRCEVEVIYG